MNQYKYSQNRYCITIFLMLQRHFIFRSDVYTKAVYKCKISRYVKSRKYSPYGVIYKYSQNSYCIHIFSMLASHFMFWTSQVCVCRGGGGRGEGGGGCTRFIHSPRPISCNVSVYIDMGKGSVPIIDHLNNYLAPGGGCEVLFSPGLSVCLSVCVCVRPIFGYFISRLLVEISI